MSSTIYERLALLITTDYAGAVSGIRKVGETADKELGKATAAGDRFALSALKIGAVTAGVGITVGAGLVSLARDASRADLAQAKLHNTLANAPQLAGANAKAFTDQATALQKVTVADDEAVLSAQALLGQYGLTQKQILELTPLVVDLSRKMGIDLDAAAKAAGKASDGQTTALQRLGVIVERNADGTVNYRNVLEALRKTVGGFSAAEGRTFEGQLTRTKHQFEELGESIGHGAVGTFDKLLGPVNSAVHGMQDFDSATGGAVGRVASIGAATAVGVGGLLLLAGAATKVRTQFDLATASETRFGAVTGTLGRLGLTATVVVAVGEALDYVSQKLTEMERGKASVSTLEASLVDFAKTGKATGELAKQFGDDLGGIGKKINPALIHTLFYNVGDTWMKDASNDIKALDKSLADLVKSGHGDVAEKVLEQFAAQGVPVDKLKDKLGEYRKALDDATLSQKLNLGSAADEKQAQLDAARAVEEHTKALEDQFTAQQKLPGAARAVDDAMTAVGDTLNAQSDATDRVAEAVDRQREAQRKYNEVLADTNADSRELLELQDRLNKASDDRRQAIIDEGKAQQRVDQLIAHGARADAPALVQAKADLDKAHHKVTSSADDEASATHDLAKAQAGDTQHSRDLAAAKKDLTAATKDVTKAKADEAKAADAAAKKQGELQQRYEDVAAAAAAQADVVAQAAGRSKASVLESADAQIQQLTILKALYPELADDIQATINRIVTGLQQIGAPLSSTAPPPLSGGTGHAKGLPEYARGGRIPGPRGRPQVAVVHGGEEVLTPEQQDELDASGGAYIDRRTYKIEVNGLTHPEATARAVYRQMMWPPETGMAS